MSEEIELPPIGEFGFEQFENRTSVWQAIVEVRERQLRESLKRIAELEEVIRQLVIQKDIHKTRAEQAEEKIAELERSLRIALACLDTKEKLNEALRERERQFESQLAGCRRR